MIIIYVDKTKLEYNDKVAYPVLASMERMGEFQVVYGTSPLSDKKIENCEILATNVKSTAEELADRYPDKQVYLIKYPLNQNYTTERKNLIPVWCWNDFQFFVYFPKRDGNDPTKRY